MNRKMAALVLLLIGIFCASTALAQSQVRNQDGVIITLKKDKASYEPGEKMVVTLTAENTNAFTIGDMELVQEVPEGYLLAEGYDTRKVITRLGPGEKAELVVVYQPDPNAPIIPDTGDDTPLSLWVGLAAAAMGTLLWLAVKRKRTEC